LANEQELKILCEMYYQQEGIRLDPASMKINAGMRALAKFMQNSHWGKYSQNPDLTYYAVVSEHHELMSYLLDSNLIIYKLQLCDTFAQIFCQKKIYSQEHSNKINVIIAAFVTCIARLNF